MIVSTFFIGRKRPGFEPAWGTFIENGIRARLENSSFETLFFGPVTDETEMRDAILRSRNAGVETIIVSQPTMGDGNLWPVLLKEWNGGIVVWATPENPKNTKVSACGLVGAHNWISGMAQAGRPPLIVYGMPGTDVVDRELQDALFVSRAVHHLSQARVGLIGDHAPGFLNMAVDASEMQKLLGARLVRFGLHEFFAMVRSFSEREVGEDRRKAEALNLPVKRGIVLADDVWNLSSRYCLALRKIVEETGLDAVALRCWPEMPNEFGVWPYLAVARLASEGIAVCEEGDVDGALGCLLAKQLGCDVPAFNSDWLEHDDQSIVLWHGGATPFQMCPPIGSVAGPTLSVHYNTGKPLVVDAELLPGMPVTLFRFWRIEGRYCMAACEGKVEAPPRKIEGCAGRVRFSGGGVNRFFLDVCTAGMPHHVVVMKGRFGRRLEILAERYRPRKFEFVRRLGFNREG